MLRLNIISYFIFSFFLFTCKIYGQNKSFNGINISNLGKDDNPCLNVDESRFLDICFDDIRKDFSFYGKKVIFLNGNTGTIVGKKSQFFENADLNNWKRLEQLIDLGLQLVILDKNSTRSYGYDAAIAIWCKPLLTPAKVTKVIKRHKRKTRKVDN